MDEEKLIEILGTLLGEVAALKAEMEVLVENQNEATKEELRFTAAERAVLHAQKLGERLGVPIPRDAASRFPDEP